MKVAAGNLQRISEADSGVRTRRAASAALVLRTLERAAERVPVSDFVLRRASAEVERMPSGTEGAILRRLLLLQHRFGDPAAIEMVVELLVDYAYELELTRRLPEAEAVLSLARVLAPESAGVSLHAGRVARKQGNREGALALYRAARVLDTQDGSIGRLAEIGEAVVSPDPLPLLGRTMRGAVRACDAEAAAVALEERARVRRVRGDRFGAARDLCIAAVRFADPADRARVGHQLADLFSAIGDLPAVREALLLALALGDSSQREHARARLHAVSRELGDEIGTRRWRSFQRPSLVSLSAPRRTLEGKTAAPRLARWREQVLALTTSGSDPAS